MILVDAGSQWGGFAVDSCGNAFLLPNIEFDQYVLHNQRCGKDSDDEGRDGWNYKFEEVEFSDLECKIYWSLKI